MKERLYYNHRNNDKPFTYDITVDFWNAFGAYYKEIINRYWLEENFGKEIGMGYTYGHDEDKFRNKLKFKVGNFYFNHYAHNISDIPSTSSVLGAIEFLYDEISSPQSVYYNEMGYDEIRTDYDKDKARDPYTIDVNNLFLAHKIGFKLKDGYIVKVRSEVLDERLSSDDIIGDDIIKDLVKNAIREYKNPLGSSNYVALNLIANALVRCTTLKGHKKTKSVTEILTLITDKEELRPLINAHWTSLAKIANNCVVRHTEHNRIEIDDIHIEEFLFYSFYNMIRLILAKLEMIDN
jgi:hypothetical protein